MKLLAIIPARKNSKRLPGKNIKLLSGKPLIVHTIQAAKKSQFINFLCISTDDPEVAAIGKKFGIKVINRPQNLAKDNTPTLPVIIHAMNFLEHGGIFEPDTVLILQPTSPLRTTENIDNSIKIFIKNKAESLQSFCQISEYPAHMFTIKDNKAKPLDRRNLSKPSKQLPKYYRENGAIYMIKKHILAKNSLYGKKNFAYIMPKEKSIDINIYEDLQLSELHMK